MENKYLSLYVDKLNNNFKHFALRFQTPEDADHGRTILQEELSERMERSFGKLLRIKRVSRNELLIYIVTRREDSKDWRAFILQILTKYKCKFDAVSHFSLVNTTKA